MADKLIQKFGGSKSSRELTTRFTPTNLDSEHEEEEEDDLVPIMSEDDGSHHGFTCHDPWIPCEKKKKKLLSKQLSMRETSREAKWEKRKQQVLERRKKMTMSSSEIEESEERRRSLNRVRSLTDEDLDELRGSIELGFGFDEENGGQALRETLPALDLLFAIKRQYSDPKLQYSSSSPASTPTATSSSSTLCGTPSPRSPRSDSWIVSPGDNPQHVKTKLRHWALAVACSVRQCRHSS